MNLRDKDNVIAVVCIETVLKNTVDGINFTNAQHSEESAVEYCEKQDLLSSQLYCLAVVSRSMESLSYMKKM